MKIRFLFIISFLMGVMLLNSCEEDPFDLFSDDPRDGLTGEWIVDEDSEIFKKKDMNRIYSVRISKDPSDSTAILVDGFYELSGKVKMIMENRNISIPDQTLNGFTIEDGSGNISFDFESMTLYYYVSFTGDRDVVRADYTRPE
jgi:hypothetical protein